MIGVSAAGPSVIVPPMAHSPSGAPPWWGSLGLHNNVLYVMWGAAAVGAIGVAAFAVLPPAGTTDTQSYAIDGNTVAVGHGPYVDTPAQMARLGDKLAVD